ncbi:MAG: hypothetical protein JWM41_821 [Gemmatimonadetes bacterium]|nr:hypothetical protein [Gemmatimonadota bacterium]
MDNRIAPGRRIQTRYVLRTGWDLVGHVGLAVGFYAFVFYVFSLGGLLGFAGGIINLIGVTMGVFSKGYWRRAVYSE